MRYLESKNLNMKLILIAIMITCLMACTSKQSYSPDASKIATNVRNNDKYTATVEIVYIEPPYDRWGPHDIDEWGPVGSDKTTQYVWYKNNFYNLKQALSREITKRGGKIEPEAKKKIKVRIFTAYVVNDIKRYKISPRSLIDIVLFLGENKYIDAGCEYIVKNNSSASIKISSNTLLTECMKISVNRILESREFYTYMNAR